MFLSQSFTYFGDYYKLITETHLITDHDTGIVGQHEAAMYEAEHGFWVRKEAFMRVSSNSGLSISLISVPPLGFLSSL